MPPEWVKCCAETLNFASVMRDCRVKYLEITASGSLFKLTSEVCSYRGDKKRSLPHRPKSPSSFWEVKVSTLFGHMKNFYIVHSTYTSLNVLWSTTRRMSSTCVTSISNFSTLCTHHSRGCPMWHSVEDLYTFPRGQSFPSIWGILHKHFTKQNKRHFTPQKLFKSFIWTFWITECWECQCQKLNNIKEYLFSFS